MSKPNPNVVDLEPLEENQLRLGFDTFEVRTFDVRPYIKEGFSKLRDPDYFRQLQLDDSGAVGWPGGETLSAETLYQESTKVKEFDAVAFKRSLQKRFHEVYVNEDGSINYEKLKEAE